MFKQVKEANAIAIGGMISSGKSSLIRSLSKSLNAVSIYELASDNGDTTRAKVDDILLEGLYNKTIHPAVFQLSFFLNRFEKYKEAISNNKDKLILFDRTIFEDRLFAHQNMADSPIEFSYYDKMWTDKINELIYLVGLPKLYIILENSFETFKERIFKRNRPVEVDNWDLNKDYFKALNDRYVPFMKGVCESYGIEYIVINTDKMNQEEVAKEVEYIIRGS